MIIKSLLAAAVIAAVSPAIAATPKAPLAAGTHVEAPERLAALPPNCRYVLVRKPVYRYVRLPKKGITRLLVGFRTVQQVVCSGPRIRRG